jgi:1,4-alpha-glucan branching enzyme
MLYLDYSREPGEWTPNVHGGHENLEAIGFLQALNAAVAEEAPGCFTAAEESTGWPGVTRSPHEGGLGFTFKWNMGWMHDTLRYFARDPIHRPWHQDELTFSMLYESSERFLMPLSHDEVVHGKRSLLGRMPGDDWQRFANLRTLLAYQWLRPGKKLVFMGTELAPEAEWNHDAPLPWPLAADPRRAGLAACMAELGAFYEREPALFANDPDTGGFEWIDCADRDNCVLAWRRSLGDRSVVVALNLMPTPHAHYRIGAPGPGAWHVRIDTDESRFGGSGYRQVGVFEAEAVPCHGLEWSLALALPPLAAVALSREAG